jgi:hypothetical protein
MRGHGVLVAGVLFGLAGPAWADGFSFSVGKGLAAVDVFHERLDTTAASDLSTRIGYRWGANVPFLLLDYTSQSVTDTSTDAEDCIDCSGADRSTSVLTVGVGAKHLFDPKVGEASPYVMGAMYTGIPSADYAGEIIGAVDEIWSLGGLAAFGAEYAFAKSFALGGEVGLNVFYVSSTDDQAVTYTQFYGAMTLNFYL